MGIIDPLNLVKPQTDYDNKNLAHEIECALLGLLLAHHRKIRDVTDIIHADVFLYDANRHIYAVLFLAYQRNEIHDIRTLEPLLEEHYFGGPEAKRDYLLNLLCAYISPLNARDYAKSLLELYNKRRIRYLSSAIMPENEKAEAMSVLWREIGRPEGGEVISLQAALSKTLEKIDQTYKRGGGFNGLATGIRDLDSVLSGLEASGLYVLAGRPGMGKSAAALTIALNIARKGQPVLFISLEMSAEQLMHRINARYADVSMWAQKNGPKDVNFHSLVQTQQNLSKTPLTIIDRAGLTIEQIAVMAHDAHRKQKQALIIIDHLGIIAARDPKMPRVYQVGEMTAAAKRLAKELELPVLLLHQLNRATETRDDKRPSLSDLRDSGSVEQDADAVMLLYREQYYLEANEPKDEAQRAKWFDRLEKCRNKAEIHLAKNRQGESRKITVRFDGVRQVFEDIA